MNCEIDIFKATITNDITKATHWIPMADDRYLLGEFVTLGMPYGLVYSIYDRGIVIIDNYDRHMALYEAHSGYFIISKDNSENKIDDSKNMDKIQCDGNESILNSFGVSGLEKLLEMFSLNKK